jgi:hypothetical protein
MNYPRAVLKFHYDAAPLPTVSFITTITIAQRLRHFPLRRGLKLISTVCARHAMQHSTCRVESDTIET